jgi:hypothetical protein
MNFRNLVLLLFSVVLFASCGEMSPNQLIGKWEAKSVMEDGLALEIDYPIIQLELSGNGTYTYQGTLNYKEAGKWRIQSKYLFTKDTLKGEGVEKAVLISELAPDSFDMEMKEGGKQRVMKMVRVFSK